MNSSKIRLTLTASAVAALVAAPSAAAAGAEAVVPPSNSAASQYTETFPTTGGDKKTDEKATHLSPAKVLGAHNAKKLREHGAAGKAAAAVAAATAPIPAAPAPEPPATTTTAPPEGGGDSHPSRAKDEGEKAEPPADNPSPQTRTVSTPTELPAGSSGVGSAVGQATGLSTSGQSGSLLPLVMLATVLWALVYLWRQRRRVD